MVVRSVDTRETHDPSKIEAPSNLLTKLAIVIFRNDRVRLRIEPSAADLVVTPVISSTRLGSQRKRIAEMKYVPMVSDDDATILVLLPSRPAFVFLPHPGGMTF